MPDHPQVRPSATVLLLRSGDAPVEILLLRRSGSSRFAADAWVFPGGVVDDSDRRLPSDLWDGIDPTALTERFRADEATVLGFHVTAVRETFEEAGVLLARGAQADSGGWWLAEGDLGRRRLRAELAAGSLDLARWLTERRIVLDLGCLTYHSRWVTPVAQPRRYDTCFFVARAPDGQVAAHDRAETTGQRWLSAAAALDEHQAGRLRLMHPTVRTLQALTLHDSPDAVITAAAAQAQVRSILPYAELDADGRVVRIQDPDDGLPAGAVGDDDEVRG
ncbi:MAG: NUDIX domain-containing protein [Actinomycetota bacterium]|jgi:8-oxo-dGTP pyrophosphatase MutT (NUDIX family)|nr:NUDIX domain-containing protein [Actinomycetota bacterium]